MQKGKEGERAREKGKMELFALSLLVTEKKTATPSLSPPSSSGLITLLSLLFANEIISYSSFFQPCSYEDLRSLSDSLRYLNIHGVSAAAEGEKEEEEG